MAKPLPHLGVESGYDPAFVTVLALREKQIQQNYRPVIGIHKWFARRPGTVFRSLLLAEFCPETPLRESFWQGHSFPGIIADPFMGGGTPLYEANRLGFDLIGCDINPMAHWIVKQSLQPLDLDAFQDEAKRVVDDVERRIGKFYKTTCDHCKRIADVKYFLWVKTLDCPGCGHANDLFPGYRVAEAERHPRHVLACSACGELNEFDVPPSLESPGRCSKCHGSVHMEGTVKKKTVNCKKCATPYAYPRPTSGAPQHRMWAIEYNCNHCYGDRAGRQFKAPAAADHESFEAAKRALKTEGSRIPIPDDLIPDGDETARLHRWGYERYRDMFGARQLLSLGILLRRIQQVERQELRHALLTVFSDTLRYQNMLCRYDTYALKCQDIFSVHGFPVGLVQCENNLLGIMDVGSGSFRHFIEKFIRGKRYCEAPFETRHDRGGKECVTIPGETIRAAIVPRLQPRKAGHKQALLHQGASQDVPLGTVLLDGVFTDPPYFDNVQYAELIDFCYAWIRRALKDEFSQFSGVSTRSGSELTGNGTSGRGLEHFTDGMSQVFSRFARALKPGAPFVFTYHHNDPTAYVPLVVAILDAGLECTATLAAAAEMSASLHISGTGSSVFDSVFVCRSRASTQRPTKRVVQAVLPFGAVEECRNALASDIASLAPTAVRLTRGDLRCLMAGHIARVVMRVLADGWDAATPLPARMKAAQTCLESLARLVPEPVAGDSKRAAPLSTEASVS